MARNEEKAQSMLNRWLAGKQQEVKGDREKRPYLASECHDLNEADKWRQQILREIGRKVMDIQNAGLGEHRIRDLNDEINKLIREKGHWERRIVELGGPDYSKVGPKVTDSEGRSLVEAAGRGAGYRYFGAAKQLPGVRELFEREAPRQVRRTRAEMHRAIDADYYGFRDEEDGILEKVEAEAEAPMRRQAIDEWEEKEAERQAAFADVRGGMPEGGAADAGGQGAREAATATQFVAYVPLPDQKEIEQKVLESKKQQLLKQYISAEEAAKQQQARELLNRRQQVGHKGTTDLPAQALKSSIHCGSTHTARSVHTPASVHSHLVPEDDQPAAAHQSMETLKRPAEQDERALAVSVKRPRADGSEVVVQAKRPEIKQGPDRTSALQAPIMLLTGHGDQVFTMRFNAEGDVIASGSHDKHIFLWRTYGECENFMMLKGHKNAVLEVHWTPDGEELISCSPDKTVRVWDAETGTEVKRLQEHKDIVNSCCPARRGPPLVVSGGDDCQAKLWDLRARNSVKTFDERYQILSVAFSEAGDQIYTAGIENVVNVWDLRREEVSVSLAGHSDSITGMRLSPDGTHLLTNSMDNTLRVWDMRPYAPANRCTKVFAGHVHTFEKNLLRCDWSPDGEKVTAGSGDRCVYIWNTTTRALMYKLPGHSGSVNECVFHPKEPIIGSASSDKTIYLGELAQ